MDWASTLDAFESETGINAVMLCRDWHSGQNSAFYKVSCNGKILDREHAEDVSSECYSNLKRMSADHTDRDGMQSLMDFLDGILEGITPH